MKTFKLDTNPKLKTGLKVPENYFDTVSENVLGKIEVIEKDVAVLPLYRKEKKRFFMTAVAAMIVFVLTIPIISHYNAGTTNQFDEDTLEAYLSSQANLTQFDLINGLDTDDINTFDQSLSFEEETLEDLLVVNPNIENYIAE